MAPQSDPSTRHEPPFVGDPSFIEPLINPMSSLVTHPDLSHAEGRGGLPATVDPSRTGDENERHFRTGHLSDDLRRRSVRGGTVTLAAQAARFALTLGSTAVLARLLRPEDFGLLGMVMAVTGFVALFKDLGLSMATVQRDEISHEQVSTLFWINVALSLLTLLVAAALAPAIAWFYNEPQLVGITLALCIGFLFSGLAVQHQALLRRQMRLTALAAISVLAMAVGIATAIVAALLGAGYWALVLQHLAMAATDAASLWFFCDWRPGLPRRHSGVRSMLFFGGNLTGFNVVNYFARNLDNVLIGWCWGPQAVAFYAKSYSLLLLPINQVNAPLSGVVIPALSRLQNDPERYRAYYKHAIGLTVAVGMPIVAFLFAAADSIVLTILGDQWLETVPIFRALAPAAFVGTFNVATGWVFVSLGQTDRQFRFGSFAAVVTVGAFFVGLPWEAVGVAWACSIAMCALRLPGLWYCFRKSPLRTTDVWAAIAPVAVASCAAATIVLAANPVVAPHLGPPGKLFAGLILFGVAYVGCLGVLPGGRRVIRQVLTLVHELRMPSRTRAKPTRESG